MYLERLKLKAQLLFNTKNWTILISFQMRKNSFAQYASWILSQEMGWFLENAYIRFASKYSNSSILLNKKENPLKAPALKDSTYRR